MRAGEVLKWCFRHSADLKFDSDRSGILLTVTLQKRKGLIICKKLLLRNHDSVADDIARFIDKLALESNLE